MNIFLILLFLAIPGFVSAADLQVGDQIPSFEVKEAMTDQDYKYLGLTKGSFFSKGKIALNDVKGELLIVQLLNRYCMVCQKEAPEFNKFVDDAEKDARLKGKVKIIGISIGNSVKEVENFKNEFSAKFPIVADRETEIYRKLGSPRGSPLVYLARRQGNGWVIVDGFKGEATANELKNRTVVALEIDLKQLKKKPLWTEEPVKRLAEGEMRKLLQERMGAITITKRIPFPHGDLYVLKKGKETLFAKEEARKAICTVCHDVLFVYVFDGKGIVRDFMPAHMTKEWNVPFTSEDIERIRKSLVGRNMLAPFKFDTEVDSVTSATLTSFLIYDSVHHGRELLDVIKKEGA